MGVSAWHRMPLDFGFTTIDILNDNKAFYYFVAGGVRGLRGGDGVPAALAVRPHAAGDPRERAPRPLSRHSGGPAHLDVLGDFLSSSSASPARSYALMNDFVDPRALRWDQSGNFVIMAVLGGMRSFWGPLIGAAIFLVLQDYLSSQTENWMSFIGLFFVLVVLFFPRGVLGIIRRKVAS